MATTSLILYSQLASSLTLHFGMSVMEVVAARHLVGSLLTQLHKQTGHNVDSIRACMHDAFDALIQSRGLDFKRVAEAHCVLDHMTASQPGTPGAEQRAS